MIRPHQAVAFALAFCSAIFASSSTARAQSGPFATTNKVTVGLSSKKINFGKVPAGTKSSPRTVTLTNKGKVELSAPAVNVTGTGFILGTNGCSSAIASAASCPVSVIFMPPSIGNFKNGLLTFTDTAAMSPQKVKLTGVGLIGPSPTPTATATPTPTATATGSATPSATPTVTATKTATPTATATPPLNVVFLTSTTYTGSINGADGLAGGDAQCASLATAAHLPAGTYKAWLSTSTVNAVSRLGTARGFIRSDGAPFADQISDITSGKILNPIDMDESGSLVSFDAGNFVWTGSTNTGTVVSNTTCDDWTSNSNLVTGEFGEFDAGPAFWSDAAGSVPCSNTSQVHLYCFDTSHTNPLTVPTVSGRVAFISKGPIHGRVQRRRPLPERSDFGWAGQSHHLPRADFHDHGFGRVALRHVGDVETVCAT